MTENRTRQIRESNRTNKPSHAAQAEHVSARANRPPAHDTTVEAHSCIFHAWSASPYAFRVSEDGGWEIGAKELSLRDESRFADAVVAALSARFQLKPGDILTRMVFRRLPGHKQEMVNVGLWVGVANSACDADSVRSCYEREIQPNWDSILAAATTQPSNAQATLPFETPPSNRDDEFRVAPLVQPTASPAIVEPAEDTRRLVARGIASRLAGKKVAGVQLSAAEGEPFKFVGAVTRPQCESKGGMPERFVGNLLGISRSPDRIKLRGTNEADSGKWKNWDMSFAYSEALAKRVADYVALAKPEEIQLDIDVLRFDQVGVGSTTSRYELRDFAVSASRSASLFPAANDAQTGGAPPFSNQQVA